VAHALRRLREARRRHDLAVVLRGGAHVDQRLLGVAYRLQHLVAACAQVLVGLLGLVRRLLWRGHLFGDRAVLIQPLLTAAVHQLDVLVAVHLQQPEGVRGEPVVVVAVQHDGVVVADAGVAEELFQPFLADDVAAHLVLQLARPVEANGAGDVAFVVGRRIDVDLDELHPGVIEVLRHPVGRNENIGRHVSPPWGRMRERAGHRA
jgi:hypothetical protein